MSGSSHPLSGDRCLHIQAARDWLNRAEKQFAGGDNVLASANLMLAQAELKLMVETVAAGVYAPGPRRSSPGFRLAPIARTAVGVAALAASLLMGVFLGRVFMPNITTPSTTIEPIQIVQAPPVTQTSPAPPTGQVEPPPSSTIGEGPTAVMSTEYPAPEPSSPPRHRRPAPSLNPPSPEPVSEQPAVAEPASSAPPSQPLESVESPPEVSFIHPAELALRTIRALSERLLEGEKER